MTGPKSRKPWVAAAAAVLGVVMIAASLWQPRAWMYVIGVLLVAVLPTYLVARLAGHRQRTGVLPVLAGVAAFAVVLALGIATPLILDHARGDRVWTAAEQPDGRCNLMTTPDRIYRCTGDGLSVIDLATGHELFHLNTAESRTVTADGGVLVDETGLAGDHDKTYYGPDGTVRWESSDVDPDLAGVVISARDGTVVLASCNAERPGHCSYTGVTAVGKISWRRTFEHASPTNLQRAQSDHEFEPAAESLAVELRGDGDQRVLILDPVTGRTLHTERLPKRSSPDEPYLSGQLVLIPVNFAGGAGECEWILYQQDELQWTSNEPCGDGDGAPHSLAGGIRRVTEHRIYAEIPTDDGERLVVFDRLSGRNRTLSDEEAQVRPGQNSDGTVDQADLLGDQVIFSFRGDRLVATDPMAGHTLWARPAPSAGGEVVAPSGSQSGVVMLDDPAIHSPFALAGMDADERADGFNSFRWPTSIDILDPRTGRQRGGGYEPDGVTGGTSLDRGVFIVPNNADSGAYLLSD